MRTGNVVVIRGLSALVLASAPLALLVNCSSSSDQPGGTGGSIASGGAAMGGATTAMGGATSANGGTQTGNGGASGGATATNGGALGSGGASGGVAGSAAVGAGGTAGPGAGGASSSGSGGASSGGKANAGTGGTGTSTGGGGAANAGAGGASSTGFALTSPDLAEGAMFGDKFDCVSKGFMGATLPELNWTEGPSGTMSYAVTLIDVSLTCLNNDPPTDPACDASTGMVQGGNATLGYHWVIYNIPANVHKLAQGLTDAQVMALPAKENSAYLGPCPNFGSSTGKTNPRTDHYEFTVYALPTATLTVSGTGTAAVKDANAKLVANSLAKAKIHATSNAYSAN